nr:MAG TPA: hypothetical protein [Caudoviricetes sp.]
MCALFQRLGRPSRGPGRGRHRSSAGLSLSLTRRRAVCGLVARVKRRTQPTGSGSCPLGSHSQM